MYKTATELLNTQNSEEESTTETSSATELTHNEQSKNNPNFWIRGNKEKGYFVTFGQHKLCESQETVEQCAALIDSKDWNLILNVVMTIIYTVTPMTDTTDEIAEKESTEYLNKQ